jgi:hypothetical protein
LIFLWTWRTLGAITQRIPSFVVNWCFFQILKPVFLCTFLDRDFADFMLATHFSCCVDIPHVCAFWMSFGVADGKSGLGREVYWFNLSVWRVP